MVTPWIAVTDLAFPESPYAEMAVEYATYVLYRLTGEKYPGVTRTTETYAHEPYISPRQVVESTTTTGSITDYVPVPVPYRVQYPQRLYLRGAPVHSVSSVRYGNRELGSSEFSLYNKRFIKLNTGASWNFGCDDRGITVDYSYGMMPPKAGVLAATTLANELLILLGEGRSDVECRIPERVRSISREGISFDMIDPMEFMDDGKTGIWEVDLFIRTANPAKAKKQPRLLSSSDARRYRR